VERWRPGAEEIERLGAQVARIIAAYLTDLPERPVYEPVPPGLTDQWATEPPPETGSEPAEILDRFSRDIASYPFGNGHPAFAAWVNSPPALIGVFAEALAAAMNPSVAGGDHAAVYLEHQVVRWLAELAGLPPGAGGLLVSGASMATLTGLAVARHRALTAAGVEIRASGLQKSTRQALLYATAEVHGCVRKAAELLGIGSANIRIVATDDAFRMRSSDLAVMLAGDLAAGDLPVAVVASADTVNTGAIDPLGEIAEVCARTGTWLHVDAAYGGPPVLLLDDFRTTRAALAMADSVAIDPHKWMYVPVDAGVLLLADPAQAREAFSLVPPYLRTDGDELPWFSEYGFEQTRPFRALKLWMTLQHLGLTGYRDLIRHDLKMAGYLREQVEAAGDLELLAAGLSVVCFRYRPDDWDGSDQELDELNRTVARAVQLSGRAYLAKTTVRRTASPQVTALRACIVNPGTTERHVEQLLHEVRTQGAGIASSRLAAQAAASPTGVLPG
jgi:glutamate/tyrosine decarboxylase-like PLP-dependent enzyme